MKNAAKRPRGKEGGRREEENPPGISASVAGRLRDRNGDRYWARNLFSGMQVGAARNASARSANVDVGYDRAARAEFRLFRNSRHRFAVFRRSDLKHEVGSGYGVFYSPSPCPWIRVSRVRGRAMRTKAAFEGLADPVTSARAGSARHVDRNARRDVPPCRRTAQRVISPRRQLA